MPPGPELFLKLPPDTAFPIQNLPFGVFRRPGHLAPRIGTRLGDTVIDLSVLEHMGFMPVERGTFDGPTLNRFMSQGRPAWRKVRERLTDMLSKGSEFEKDGNWPAYFLSHDEVEMLMPIDIGDYTDFYSSRHHATNVGTMLRGADNALQENWTHLPVAYHGRASSVVLSGTDVRRPRGQTGPGAFGPSKALDFELEVGFFVGPGTELGEPIAVENAHNHIFGMVLVNDWSARDIQKWEYVPLGPFLAKNFATSISPWVVTLDALEPFRVPAPTQDPEPLPYMKWAGDHTYNINLEVSLAADGGPPATVCRSNFRYLYWTMAQQLAHHTVNGCDVRPGDLLASGTVSGPEKDSRGCLLELTWRGSEPLQLPGGQTRTFLNDGDTVTMTAWCQGDGYRVGFGEVAGRVLPAAEL